MIDKIDIQIIEILQDNARSTASDIAKEVNLSVPAAGERIKKLIESGLIFLKTIINLKLLNHLYIFKSDQKLKKNGLNNIKMTV